MPSQHSNGDAEPPRRGLPAPPVLLPEGHDPAPSRPPVTRRAVLVGSAAVLAGAGAAGAAWLAGRRDPGTSAAPPSAAPVASDSPTSVNVSVPDGDDATQQLQDLLDGGGERVVLPVGTHTVSATLVVPWQVRAVELPAGAIIRMAGDEIAVRRSGEVERTLRPVERAVEGESAVTLDARGLAVGDWLYLCADDWVKVDKSKVGMMRRVVALDGDVVTVDKPLIRTLTLDPRAHRVTLAPPLVLSGAGAIENSSPTTTASNLVRLDLVEDAEVRGIELRDCGTAALRTFATVGGTVDCWIHDCEDDPPGGRYGYGVSATSATRDLTVRGRIERVRHAFTTDHGYDAPLESMALTGEPEDVYVAPVVRDTSSTGLDTHEPGYGITLVPDVSGSGTTRWGGVNVRARNVTIEGGSVRDSYEWGILVSESASGTVIRDVAVEGVREGRGIDCRTATTIEGGSVSGFGGSFGLDVREGATVSMVGTVIDGSGSEEARGIALAGQDCRLEGTVRNCRIGVLERPAGRANTVLMDFEAVDREMVTAGS